MADQFDIAVIGSGPGGYVAAIRAAQLGARVAIVEKDELGGTCLNRGCIPAKALLASAEVLEQTERAAEFGVVVGSPSLDFAKALARKDRVVRQLRAGVQSLLSSNAITVFKGTASLQRATQIVVETPSGTQVVESKSIILATGAADGRPESLGTKAMVTSTEVFQLAAVPPRLLVVCSELWGVEFAFMFHRFGSKVTIAVEGERLLSEFDAEPAQQLVKSLETRGVRVFTKSTALEVREQEGGNIAVLATPNGNSEIGFDQGILALARKPNSAGIGLEKVGVKTIDGRVSVDKQMRTSVPNIYAIGDLVGEPMLAHVATAEGIVAVENALGGARTVDYHAAPRCLYTSPALASVGMTEDEAKAKSLPVKVGRFPYAANGRASTLGRRDGLVKVVSEERYGEILGVHIFGPYATELIAEAAMAIRLEATVEDLARAIHAHPTLAEATGEAALDVLGIAIHMPAAKAAAKTP